MIENVREIYPFTQKYDEKGIFFIFILNIKRI